MNKSAYIRARVEPTLKANAEAVFEELGITPSQVITMLYKQVSRKQEIPLDLYVPNEETVQAIEEARTGKGTVICKDADDLFNQLDI